MSKPIMYDVCETCGKFYLKSYELQLYCSPECNPKKQKKVEKKEHKISINEITRLASAEHLTYGQYCAKHGL